MLQVECPTACFWRVLEQLVLASQLVIDRPAGSRHPRYPELFYPLDYGYLAETSSMDEGGIDVWVGSLSQTGVTGVVVTVDLTKRDSEIKVLLCCTPEEMATATAFHNADQQAGLLIVRDDQPQIG